MKALRSFVYAFNGIAYCFKNERNFRIHCLAAIGVIVSGIVFNITNKEWMLVLLCIVLVFSLEMFNTAIEKLCDLIHPEPSEKVKVIKDVSAGAVLIGALVSCVIGAIIFLPKIL